MKKFSLIIYYLLFSSFPNSWYPGGGLFNYLRIITARKFIKIGKNNKVEKGVYFGNGNNVTIGDNCQINEKTRLDNVKIGNNVMIARECIILGKTHDFESEDIPMVLQGRKENYETLIMDDVWLGLRVIVMPGITISKGSIIGAGAVVTKDTSPNCIYGGIPAKLIRKR